MWPDRVSNPGPLTCESAALPTALRGPTSEKNFSSKYPGKYLHVNNDTCCSIGTPRAPDKKE